MSHGDTVLRPPKGFTALGATPNCPVAAMADATRKLYAVQFHPEVVHTPQGRTILDNFLDICGARRTWSMAGFIDSTVQAIRERVGDQRVLCALSGGVDSSVVAVLVHRAIGDQLTCVFVDNGLLRKGEAQSVVHTFRDTFKINLIHVEASRRFLDVLHGVTDPELKRKRIGAEFIAVFEDEARRLGEIRWLAQGTLYPDVIESVSFRGPSATSGYYRNAEATRELVAADGWLDTGDIGHLDRHQNLVISGREKDIVVLSNGENVNPVPLETVISRSDYVASVMVTGHDWKSLGALIVPNIEMLKQFCEKNSIHWQEKHIQAVLEQPVIRELYRKEIIRLVNNKAGFKDYELVREFRFLSEPFEVGRELTATLKLKRKKVNELYSQHLESMKKSIHG